MEIDADSAAECYLVCITVRIVPSCSVRPDVILIAVIPVIKSLVAIKEPTQVVSFSIYALLSLLNIVEFGADSRNQDLFSDFNNLALALATARSTSKKIAICYLVRRFPNIYRMFCNSYECHKKVWYSIATWNVARGEGLGILRSGIGASDEHNLNGRKSMCAIRRLRRCIKSVN